MPTSRQGLRAGAATLVAGVEAGLYAWRIEPHWIEVRAPSDAAAAPAAPAARADGAHAAAAERPARRPAASTPRS